MQWQNRIVGHGEEDPEQLAANPLTVNTLSQAYGIIGQNNMREDYHGVATCCQIRGSI